MPPRQDVAKGTHFKALVTWHSIEEAQERNKNASVNLGSKLDKI
jgi:hypothetical protein